MSDLEPFLPFAVRNAVQRHMLEDAPNEACGVITFASGEYAYERCKNISAQPTATFKFDKATNRRVNMDDAVVAFVHSHPAGDPWPSKRDMEIQKLIGKPSVICSTDPRTGVVEVFSFGDHMLDAPLDGRTFRYGVQDCYEAIRSWRWQREGVKMDAFPRHDNWWAVNTALPEQDRDMYTRNFESQGYVRFEPNFSDPRSAQHPQIGDLILMKIGATVGNVVNHAGIYIGDNKVYHHRVGKKSGDTPIGYLPNGTIRCWARQGDKM